MIYKIIQGRIQDFRKGGGVRLSILNRCLWRLPESEVSKATRGGGDVGRGALPTRLRGLGSVVSSPSGVRGRALEAFEFLRYDIDKKWLFLYLSYCIKFS